MGHSSGKTHIQSLLSVQFVLTLGSETDPSSNAPAEYDLRGSHIVLHRQLFDQRILALLAAS